MKLTLLSSNSVEIGWLSRIALAVFAVGFLLLFITMPGFAAEWSFVPSMGTKAYFNDNLLLTPLPHNPTYGYWISPGMEFSGKTERLEVSGRAALDFVDYYGGETSRFTNVFLPLTMKYRTEKDEWGFTGGFTRDNTLMGELLTTGLVLRFTQRNLWMANPTWTRILTEKFAFQGTFQFSDASYKDGLRLRLVDYQVFGGSAGFIYHATERDDIQLSGTYTNFQTINAPFGLRSVIPGAMATLTHSFTETLKGTAFGGPRFVTSTSHLDGAAIKAQDTVWVYGASLTQQFERANLQLSVARDIMPSGFGQLIQTDRVGILASYDFSETITASLDASGYVVTGITSQVRGSDFPSNRLLYVTPQISWKLSDWWKLDVSYSYRWRDADGFVDPVMANMVTLLLTYFPPKFAVSN